jgi:hypothetical protein
MQFGGASNLHRKSGVSGKLGSLYPDEYTKAESIRLELGVDVNAGHSGQKTRRVIVVAQVPKLILEVDHTKIQGAILVIVHATPELVNNAVVRLAIVVRNVPGADHEVAIRAKSAVNVVKFGAEHKGSLFSVGAAAIGEAGPHGGLTEHEPPQAEISAGGKGLIPTVGIQEAGGRRRAWRVVKRRVEVGFHQGV